MKNNSWKPFFSVLIIILSLFSLVFMHMEVRRMGYEILTLSKEERAVQDRSRLQSAALAKITGPARLQNVAQTRWTLKRASPEQIIHMTEQGYAVTP